MRQLDGSILLVTLGAALLGMWSSHLWGTGPLAKLLRASSTGVGPPALRTWLLTAPLMGVVCTLFGILLFPGLARGAIPGIGIGIAASFALLVVCALWALITPIPLPPFVDSRGSRAEERSRERFAVLSRQPDPVVIRESRPWYLLGPAAGLAFLGLWFLLAPGDAAKTIGGFSLLLAVLSSALALRRLTRRPGLTIDREGILRTGPFVQRRILWRDVASIEAAPTGAILRTNGRAPTPGGKPSPSSPSPHPDTLLSSLRLPISSEHLTALLRDWKEKA